MESALKSFIRGSSHLFQEVFRECEQDIYGTEMALREGLVNLPETAWEREMRSSLKEPNKYCSSMPVLGQVRRNPESCTAEKAACGVDLWASGHPKMEPQAYMTCHLIRGSPALHGSPTWARP